MFQEGTRECGDCFLSSSWKTNKCRMWRTMQGKVILRVGVPPPGAAEGATPRRSQAPTPPTHSHPPPSFPLCSRSMRCCQVCQNFLLPLSLSKPASKQPCFEKVWRRRLFPPQISGAILTHRGTRLICIQPESGGRCGAAVPLIIFQFTVVHCGVFRVSSCKRDN